MIAYVLRRLWQSALTVFGVMVLTFLLFRAMPGDIAAPHIGTKATQQQRADWLHTNGYDRPVLVNVHRRLLLTDNTKGGKPFAASDRKGSRSIVGDSLALIAIRQKRSPGLGEDSARGEVRKKLYGRFVRWLSEDTPMDELTDSLPLVEPPPKGGEQASMEGVPTSVPSTAPASSAPSSAPSADGPVRDENAAILRLGLSDASILEIDITGVETAGELISRINEHPDNVLNSAAGSRRVDAGTTRWSLFSLFDSQFVDHLVKSVTFSGRSLRTNKKLTEVISERAPASLSLTVPSLAIGWMLALVISSFVAYFRGTRIDKVVVFLSVLGMCVPFLAFMIYGQWFMFKIAPTRAYGLYHRSNIYVPIVIMVLAGLGGSVRFYRTVILDQVNRDYVRTARAKGASLPTVLFKHVLKNCMLPILTNLILALPFLMMGSLLVETYFGIPGLGDLMITSITSRDEPIMNALVFLTAAIYVVGLIVTDLFYAVFDPRIRLQ